MPLSSPPSVDSLTTGSFSLPTFSAPSKNETGARKTGANELVDLRPLEGAAFGSAFIGKSEDSGSEIEVRLLPWAKDAGLCKAIAQRIRLTDLLVAHRSRRVLESYLHLSPPRLHIERLGQSLRVFSNQLTSDGRIEVAKAIWDVACRAIQGGLFQGTWSPDHIWIIDSNNYFIQVDFLAQFYCEQTYENEPTVESEARAAVELMRSLLAPLFVNDALETELSGKQRAQLRSLLGQEVEVGRELDQFERWSQMFTSFDRLPDIAARSCTPAGDIHVENLTSQSSDATCEVVVNLPHPYHDDSDDRTGEIQVTTAIPATAITPSLEIGSRIGRFRIDSLLGQGGMGVVYRGFDLASEEAVAIKLLRPSGSDVAQAVRRFKKEARLLASIQNEYITRLVDAGYESGFHFIAMEYVPGINLKDWLGTNSVVDETSALKLVADIARALTDAHRQEIVHRDIKPENILLKSRVQRTNDMNGMTLDQFQVKLSDFGIARTVEQSLSMEVTRAGTLLGTPVYMSPEQCKGNGSVSPASDIYSLGILLYTILAGRPPFESDDPMQLAAKHCFEPPVEIQRRNPRVTEMTSALLSRMLAKDPANRPSDAAQLVHEIENLLRGETSGFEIHPKLPETHRLPPWERVFEWDLKSLPTELWPYVSNTERLNRAAGLQSVQYRSQKSENGELRKFGTFKIAGMQIEWEEHPFEWIEGKRMSILREFVRGPFVWFMSLVELTPKPEGGTRLRHTVHIAPRGNLGRIVAMVEAGWKGGRALDRIYRRIDQALQSQQRNILFDPYEAPPKVTAVTRRRIEQRIEKMIQLGVRPELAQQLMDFVLCSAPQVLARIRPLDLSDRLNTSAEEMIDACLVAARCGVLQLRWDILCPTCRAAASTTGLLSEIGKHTECEACDTEFQSNIASAIELVFQCHPEIRAFDDGHYCIGGPEHSPHVVTQVRLAPNERIELSVPIKVGDYLLRATRNPHSRPLRSRSQAAPSSLDLCLSQFETSNHTPVVRSGLLTLALTNDIQTTQVVRLERTIDRSNVVTAATASALPRFRELFPGQVFAREQAIAAEELTLLAVRVLDPERLYAVLGDASAYQVLQHCFAVVEGCIAANHGAVIKSVGETVFGSFADSIHAISTAFEIEKRLIEHAELSNIRFAKAVHRGPLLVTTQNGRLDYFGTTARQLQALCNNTDFGIALTDTVFVDAGVQERLHQLPSGVFESRNCWMELPQGNQRLIQLILPRD